VDKKIVDWYNGKAPGLETEKAYKKLKKKTSETVIVAVIDSGVDIEHEDLKGKIWKNEKEVAGNGIDDDKNGYIDDVYGWSFLGDSNDEQLEMTRIYAKLDKKYANISASDAKNKEEYALYEEVKEKVDTERKKAESQLENIKKFQAQLPMIKTMVETELGKDYTQKDVDAWKPSGPMAQMKDVAMPLKTGALEKQLEGGISHFESSLGFHYNVDHDGRKSVGDNPDDFSDIVYGNNKVEGPDALHGTHVAGIIAAVRNNGIGGSGVAENVKIMAIRAIPNGDERDKDVALAIRYAVDNGAKVINMSFGKSYSPNQKEVYEAIKYAEKNDVLLVHAAGNDNKDVDTEPNFPAAKFPFQKEDFTTYLTIGASTRYKKPNTKKGQLGLAASFSNYGDNTVDVFAPGFEIYNTVPDNQYQKLQGTSMAAPMVSGVAALIKGYFPKLTMKQVKEIIMKSAKNYGETSQVKPGTDETMIPFKELSKTGGCVNIPAAIKMAATY
jgi:subtilisin family serine protease